jgi:hypothetical protein
VAIGGAAVLAPKYLPRLRRSLQPAFDSIFSGSKPAAAASDGLAAKLPLAVPETLKIRRAVAKTITFRIIATTLDFTTNYLVIGELGAAAGLSSFALVSRAIRTIPASQRHGLFPHQKEVKMSKSQKRRESVPHGHRAQPHDVSRKNATGLTALRS